MLGDSELKKRRIKKKEENVKMPASKKKLDQSSKKAKPTKRKERKRSKTKKNKKILKRVLIFLVFIAIISVVVYTLITQFKLEKIEITGNETYTTEEVQKAIQENKYTKNTLQFFLVELRKKDTFLPFIEKAEIKLKNRNTISIQITEKKRIGKIVKDGYNWYYDREGILLEKTTKDYDNVVTVEGLTYREMKLNEKIPVVQSGCYDVLLTISQSISKYGTPIQKIWIKSTEDIQLIAENFIIDLGTSDYLEQKMEELYPAMKAANEQGLQGTIDMKNFTEEQKRIIFY